MGTATASPGEVPLSPFRRGLQLFERFHGLVGMFAWWVTSASGLLAQPDIAARYSFRELFTPTQASVQLSEATPKPIVDLVKSPQLLRVVIENNLGSRVTDVALRINTVKSVADVAIGASFARLDAEGLATYELKGGAMTFPKLTEIPPRTTLILLVWGDFGSAFPRPPVEVAAAVSRIEVSRIEEVAGVRAFVSRNLVWIGLILTLYFLLQGLYSADRRRP